MGFSRPGRTVVITTKSGDSAHLERQTVGFYLLQYSTSLYIKLKKVAFVDTVTAATLICSSDHVSQKWAGVLYSNLTLDRRGFFVFTASVTLDRRKSNGRWTSFLGMKLYMHPYIKAVIAQILTMGELRNNVP